MSVGCPIEQAIEKHPGKHGQNYAEHPPLSRADFQIKKRHHRRGIDKSQEPDGRKKSRAGSFVDATYDFNLASIAFDDLLAQQLGAK
jgi:hypothetical protein